MFGMFCFSPVLLLLLLWLSQTSQQQVEKGKGGLELELWHAKTKTTFTLLTLQVSHLALCRDYGRVSTFSQNSNISLLVLKIRKSE